VTPDRSNPKRMARHALTGEGAHVATKSVFDGLDWTVAGIRPPGAAHTLFEVLNHMTYWQDWVVHWLAGQSPPVPKHASGGWPGEAAPATRAAWARAVRHFKKGLATLERGCELPPRPRRGGKTGIEMLALTAAHNTYHAGQVVVLRQLAGCWPPPSGGATW
jgi:uncharacterized damage-inducible protein DinB